MTKYRISKVKIDLYEWSTWKKEIVSSTENEGSYTWTVNQSLADDYTVYDENSTFTIM